MNMYKKAAMQNLTFNTGNGVVSIGDLYNISIDGDNGSLDKTLKILNQERFEMLDSLKPKNTDNIDLKIAIIEDVFKTRTKMIERHVEIERLNRHNKKIAEALVDKELADMLSMSDVEMKTLQAKNKARIEKLSRI